MTAVLAVLDRVWSWVVQPLDYQPCMWPNLTDEDES